MSNNRDNGRLPGLDAIRGISIMLVLLCHSSWFNYLPFSKNVIVVLDQISFPLGFFGVPMFFVVSGFLITFLLLREEKRNGFICLKYFWMRRCLRIIPPVLAYIIFIIIYAWFNNVHLDRLELTAIVLFFRNLTGNQAMLAHFWSLSVEEQFYLFWPLILVFLPRRKRLRITVALMVLLPLIRLSSIVFLPQSALFIMRPLAFDSILVGCLLAIVWDRLNYRKFSAKNGDELFIGGLLSIFIAWFISYYSEFRPYAFEGSVLNELLLETLTWFLNVGIACVIIALVTESSPIAVSIKTQWLVPVGLISYSLYIWQQFFFFIPNPPYWMRPLLVRVSLAFGAAICAYYLIEKPLNQFRRRFKNRVQAQQAILANQNES